MKIIKKIAVLRKEIARVKLKGKSVGFVPTMGALHAGHLSLIRAARRNNDLVAVSIFINPIQFGPSEDFKKYPRDLKEDARLCAKEGADIIFFPDAKEMYPRGFATFVTVEGLSDVLCGVSRPGHFRGVATVVAKLINIVAPDVMYMGQKDAQQALIVQKMVRDLNLPVKVRVEPTVRSPEGLALSSRNAYLNNQERNEALVLYRSLVLARKLIRSGHKEAGIVIRRMKAEIAKAASARIDYVSIVDLEHLLPLKKIDRPCLAALAVRIGKTRLIDNMVIGT